MKKSRIVFLCVGALAITTVFCVNGCILHWPDAPFTDTSAVLSNDALMALRSRYADAKLISPVFRRHLERRRDKDVVTDELFLFADASDRSRRGHIDAEGRLTVHPVTFVDRLPEKLQQSYFDSKAPIVAGGQVTGRVWRFIDGITNNFVYEFEFTVGTLCGIGLIDASGDTGKRRLHRAKRGGECIPMEPNKPVDAPAITSVVEFRLATAGVTTHRWTKGQHHL